MSDIIIIIIIAIYIYIYVYIISYIIYNTGFNKDLLLVLIIICMKLFHTSSSLLSHAFYTMMVSIKT